MDLKQKPYKMHAIQLKDLRVSELSISVDLSMPRTEHVDVFTMETGRSPYDTDTHQIQVKIRVVMGDENEKSPFRLAVELHGLFEVDETKFDVKFIEDWAEKNAPLVLYPYIREHVYSLTGRAGFPEARLPLIEIPTFRVTSLSDVKTLVP